MRRLSTSNKKVSNLVLFGISFVLIAGGCSLKINKDQSKFYDDVNKYTSEFQDDDFQICAHRGFSSKEVENTLDSIKEANNAPYIDYIEMDVRMTKDNQFVLSHDDKLYNLDHFIKVSNVDKDNLLKVKYTYTDLDMFSFNLDGDFIHERNHNLFNKKFKLTDLITGIENSNNKKILLDLKIEDNNRDDFIDNFVKVLDDIDTSNITIQSKNIDGLKKIKEKRDDLEYSPIIDRGWDFKEIDGFDNITVKKNYINNPIVKEKVKNGDKVFVWNVNTNEDFYNVANYFFEDYDKVIYISDYPNEISYLLNDYKKIIKKTMK